MAKNINKSRFLQVAAYLLIAVFFFIACDNVSLEKDHHHQAAKAIDQVIDSVQTQIHTEIAHASNKLEKEVHAGTAQVSDKLEKAMDTEAVHTPDEPKEMVQTETSHASDKPKKAVHTEANHASDKPEKAVHIEANHASDEPKKAVQPETSHASDKPEKAVHAETTHASDKPDKLKTPAPYIDTSSKENLLRSYVSWAQFFITAVGLFVLYFILSFAKQILTNTQYCGNLRLPLLSSIERILIFYEPIVILLLGSAFVLINPVSHGMWVALLLIAGFSHVKNYISGRILQLDKGMSIGNRIKVDNQKGLISAIDRLGIQLTTEKGTQYLNYSKLSDDGFMLLSGDEIGGNYTLKISPKEYNERMNYPDKLMDLFTTTPFLDWSHRPKIGNPSGEQHSMNVKLMVREDGHLRDLMQMIEERGYVCSVK